jgi:hypothetical protein
MAFILPQISDQNISNLLSIAQSQLPKASIVKGIVYSGVLQLGLVTVSFGSSLYTLFLRAGHAHISLVYLSTCGNFQHHRLLLKDPLYLNGFLN